MTSIEIIHVHEPGLPETYRYISRTDFQRAMTEFNVPDHNIPGLIRYFELGIMPGNFLSAVLRNDLKDAVRCADSINARNIVSVVRWLYNCAPAESWGSPENVLSWVKWHIDRRNKEEGGA